MFERKPRWFVRPWNAKALIYGIGYPILFAAYFWEAMIMIHRNARDDCEMELNRLDFRDGK